MRVIDEMAVYCQDRLAGHLRKTGEMTPRGLQVLYDFQYVDSALEEDLVSLAMPVGGRYDRLFDVPPAFQVSLPEGWVYKQLVSAYGKAVDLSDPFALLKVAGRNPVGRVTFGGARKPARMEDALRDAILHEDHRCWMQDILEQVSPEHLGVSGAMPKLVVDAQDGYGPFVFDQHILKLEQPRYSGIALAEEFALRCSAKEYFMRIAYASDLHLEFGSPLTLTGLSGVDVLVLAGDVDTMPEDYTEFLRKLRLAYDGPVIFVLGNHEYYNGVFPDDRQKYREAIAHDCRAFLLENEAVVLGGVRFLGATLWTDFAGGKQMRNCQHMMSDFAVIQEGENGSLITPDAILKVHQESIAWLEDQFTNHPHDGPTEVITHHAPSFQSQHPRFAGSPISGGFCSNLDRHVERWKPDVWIHGHVHDPMDYRLGKPPLQGATRVLCNPWGYPDEGRAREYRVAVLRGTKTIAD